MLNASLNVSSNMKHIKPSINVTYIIEVKDLHGSSWTPFAHHNLIKKAIEDVEENRKTLPKCKFRLIRSEWEVIG